MRKPDITHSVTIGTGTYTTEHMLREFVWGHPAWAADEASAASLSRCAAALKTPPLTLEDRDFDRVCGVLRALNFPMQASIELAELRNAFVLTPKEPE